MQFNIPALGSGPTCFTVAGSRLPSLCLISTFMQWRKFSYSMTFVVMFSCLFLPLYELLFHICHIEYCLCYLSINCYDLVILCCLSSFFEVMTIFLASGYSLFQFALLALLALLVHKIVDSCMSLCGVPSWQSILKSLLLKGGPLAVFNICGAPSVD